MKRGLFHFIQQELLTKNSKKPWGSIKLFFIEVVGCPSFEFVVVYTFNWLSYH